MAINTTTATIDLGHVFDGRTTLKMMLTVHTDRTAQLELFMSDGSSRRNGELLILGQAGATELKELLVHAERTVGQMIGSGQISALKLDR